MKALIVGATKDIVYGCNLLKKNKIESFALDGNNQAEGFSYSDYSQVVDISDESACIQFAKENQIDFLLPVPVGRFITTWGAINDALNLKGISKKMAENCADKWRFHNKLKRDGLRNAQTYLINRKNMSVPKLNFPMILKPRFGSGSRAVSMIENQSELEAHLKDYDFSKEHFILETAVSGVEFGVDALVLNEEFHMVLLREKVNTPPPNRQAIGYFSNYDEERFPNLRSRVEEKLKKVIECLELDNCLLHADVMINEEDVFVIELSPRPSGHNLHNNFTIQTTGYDMLQEFIRFQVGEPYMRMIPYTKNTALLYFDFENVRFTDVPKNEEIEKIVGVLQADVRLEKGTIRNMIAQGSDIINDGFVILEAPTRDEILRIYRQIKEMFKVEDIV